jgi:hypothetical protein
MKLPVDLRLKDLRISATELTCKCSSRQTKPDDNNSGKPRGVVCLCSDALLAVQKGCALCCVIVFLPAAFLFGGIKTKVAYEATVTRNTVFALPCEKSLCQSGNLLFFLAPKTNANKTTNTTTKGKVKLAPQC